MPDRWAAVQVRAPPWRSSALAASWGAAGPTAAGSPATTELTLENLRTIVAVSLVARRWTGQISSS